MSGLIIDGGLGARRTAADKAASAARRRRRVRESTDEYVVLTARSGDRMAVNEAKRRSLDITQPWSFIDRCYCGCKYFTDHVCVDCGDSGPGCIDHG